MVLTEPDPPRICVQGSRDDRDGATSPMEIGQNAVNTELCVSHAAKMEPKEESTYLGLAVLARHHHGRPLRQLDAAAHVERVAKQLQCKRRVFAARPVTHSVTHFTHSHSFASHFVRTSIHSPNE